MARILVVDDAPTILDLYRDILTDAGYEVWLETGPTLDLDTVEQAAPDLIILDYLFGYEAAGLVMVQQLTMRPATARLPIIVCTAAVHLIKEVQPDLERQGIVVVSKPFAIDELLRRVAQALASHRWATKDFRDRRPDSNDSPDGRGADRVRRDQAVPRRADRRPCGVPDRHADEGAPDSPRPIPSSDGQRDPRNGV